MEPRAYRIPVDSMNWAAIFSDNGLRELCLPGSKKASLVAGMPVLRNQEADRGALLRALLHERMKGQDVDLPWTFFDLRARPPYFVAVWRAMQGIPFGEVRSYGWLSRRAGSEKAVRATGQACGANPIVLFLPCHRVVAAAGPGGFGCGLAWKKKLLALEGFCLKGVS